MKALILIIIPVIFCHLHSYANFQTDRQKIYQQYLDYNLSGPPADSLTKKYLYDMREDGTWSYVDYKNTRRGGWPTPTHLQYCEEMAKSYAHPKSKYFHNTELKASILKGLQYWLDADLTNENWYPIYITVPRYTLSVFLYLGNEIPDKMKEEAWKKMFEKLHMHRTGSNQVIAAEIEIMKAIYYNRQDIMDKAIEVMWSEVRLTTEEGIQPDWCFHQHGNQPQIGNYGLSYSGRVTEWAYLLRGTSYSLPAEKLRIHSNFLLNAPAWFLWKGTMDLNASGRQYKLYDSEVKYNGFMNQFVLMQKIDPENKTKYKQISKKPQKLTGQNSFWRSDLAVHREKNWMASLSMSSSRVIGTELCNMENFEGVHLADGRLLITLSGKEYRHIAPLWNWNRLPGTTCDQEISTLTPSPESHSKSDFSGVLGDENKGIATMHYIRNNLKAQKSWFFLNDAIVCLGAGISGETAGTVLTSVEQSNLMGEISSSQGRLDNKMQRVDADCWVHHNGIGYYLLSKAEINVAHVIDNWQKCFPTYNDIPAQGDVFSISIDHGKNPQSGTYAYVIYPDVEASKMNKIISKNRSIIVSNSESVQAVKSGNDIMAVFYVAGKLVVDTNTTIVVDAPCLLMLNNNEIRVSDPFQNRSTLNVTINDKRYILPFLQNDQKGKQTVQNRL